MNFEALYVNPTGRTATGPYVGALVVLLAAAAFYYLLVPGRTGQFAMLTLLYPALALHARRLHDMGKPGWIVLIPGAAIAATAWLHLSGAAGGAVSFVTGAAIGVSAAIVLWSLVGRGRSAG